MNSYLPRLPAVLEDIPEENEIDKYVDNLYLVRQSLSNTVDFNITDALTLFDSSEIMFYESGETEKIIDSPDPLKQNRNFASMNKKYQSLLSDY